MFYTINLFSVKQHTLCPANFSKGATNHLEQLGKLPVDIIFLFLHGHTAQQYSITQESFLSF